MVGFGSVVVFLSWLPARRARLATFILETVCRETYLSTEQARSQTPPRLPQAQRDRRRLARPCPPACQRPQATFSLISAAAVASPSRGLVMLQRRREFLRIRNGLRWSSRGVRRRSEITRRLGFAGAGRAGHHPVRIDRHQAVGQCGHAQSDQAATAIGATTNRTEVREAGLRLRGDRARRGRNHPVRAPRLRIGGRLDRRA